MQDNLVIAVFRPLVIAGLAARGISDVQVKANYQPTQQGRVDGSAIYFNKILDHRYGFQGRSDKWNADNSTMVTTQKQKITSTWQFNCAINDDPENETSYTASDYLRLTSNYLQSAEFVASARAGGIGILRITDIRTTWAQNDRAQYEANPSFDAIITHDDVFTTVSPVVTKFNGKLRRV